MKKLCFVTTARSEYGLIKWLLNDALNSCFFEVKLVVAAGHLLPEQGYTINQILKDGFNIDYIVDVRVDVSSNVQIADSMGKLAEGFAKAFDSIAPDYVVVIGDRYELLPICNTAFIMNIPIIHISGGDVTTGAIDNGIRNAVTMLASYHFPGTKESAENIIRMRGETKNIWAVGEPGLDSFTREKLLSRDVLAEDLGIDSDKKWILMTYHPETCESLEHNLVTLNNCVEALIEDDVRVVITYANADFGGDLINKRIEEYAKKNSDRIVVVPSLGHGRYLSLLKQVSMVIGNSSSGIVEAPFLNIPVVNIGDRQNGRYQCENIVQSGSSKEEICNAIIQAKGKNGKIFSDNNYWGDGHTSERIMCILSENLI